MHRLGDWGRSLRSEFMRGPELPIGHSIAQTLGVLVPLDSSRLGCAILRRTSISRNLGSHHVVLPLLPPEDLERRSENKARHAAGVQP